MNLVGTDQAFVRLVCGHMSDRVEVVLKLRPDRLDDMCGMKGFNRVRALRDVARLAAQLAVAPMRSTGVRDDSLFFERSRGVLARRHEFLRRFLGHDLSGVSIDSRVIGHRSWLRSLSMVAGVIRLLLDPKASESKLASVYVGILRTCLVVGSHAESMGARDAYLFRVYRPETPILAAWLMARGVEVHQVASTGPLLPNTPGVVADSVILCNPFQQDEIAWMQSQGYQWPRTIFWGPEDIVELESVAGWGPREHHAHVLGLYTQGFRARVRMGSEAAPLGTMRAEHEEMLREILVRYVDAHPEVELRVYPHPLERRIFRAEGTHDLHDLEDHDRIVIDWSSASSLSGFAEVGLGLTTFSTIGFDRLYLGYPSVFLVTDEVQEVIPSPFQRLFIRDDSALCAVIDRFRVMNPVDFMHDVFGGPFGPPNIR